MLLTDATLYLGNTPITYVYLGNTQIYPLSKYDTRTQKIIDSAKSKGYEIPTDIDKIDSFIKGIPLSVWNKLDSLFLFGSSLNNRDTNFNRIDFIKPTRIGDYSGGIEFSTNGIKGNGTNAYFNTNFNPFVDGKNYTLNNASRGVLVTEAYTGGGSTSVLDGTVNMQNNMLNSVGSFQRINQGSNNQNGNVDLRGTGLKVINRTASSTVNTYSNNGTQVTMSTSTNIPNTEQFVLRNTGSFGTAKIGLYFIGSEISLLEANTIESAFNTYVKKTNDADVDLFLDKVPTLITTEIDALNKCVTSLKNESLFSKIRVFYPMLGGTAESTKYDFMNKNNNKFNISWSGGAEFSLLGVQGNGINGYGDTNFNPFTEFGNNTTVGYGATICVGTGIVENFTTNLGYYEGERSAFLMSIRGNGQTVYLNVNLLPRHADKLGILSCSRTLNIAQIKFNNNITAVNTSGVNPNHSLYILSEKPTQGNSKNRMQSTLIHEGLTQIETATLQTIINKFEQDLNRKTW